MLFPLLLLAACPGPSFMQDSQAPAPPLEGRTWLNTDHALTWEELRGQVVLLDFWTYCCINCMHVIPDLARLESDFRDEPFLVIGVHSAKFEEEGDERNIRQAVLRYGVHHPVVVDEGMKIWRSFGVQSWPTLVLVGPEGHYLGFVAGEGQYENLKAIIREVLDKAREAGTLAEAPIRVKLEKRPATRLSYPGKVHWFDGKLYVADSTANRVLEVDPGDGRVLRSFGSGEAGWKDGPAGAARFRNPQGMAGFAGALFVADTDNHAIRRIDLESGGVTTIAGNGVKSEVYPPHPGLGTQTLLNSPWDLATDGRRLFVAMAGCHQLWSYDFETKRIEPLAGTGRENITDGPLAQANLAQPSGLALAGEKLYFSDSEVSAVRVADLKAKRVETLVGEGLFEFGDRDGRAEAVRLQHPLGVAVWKDKLLVADTYNNKIKLLDPKTRSSETFLGTGNPGIGGERLTFYEPGGLAVHGNTLFVADTNHHRIVAVDLATRKARVLLGGQEAAPPAAPVKKSSD